jgi:hypothetical protein
MQHATALKEIISRMQSAAGDDHLRIHHKAITARAASIAEAVSSLESMAKNRNPMETEAAHARRVADAARKLNEKVASVEALISNTVQSAVYNLDEAINSRANLREDSYAAEIRASVRGLPEKDRFAAVQAAVKAGDARTVAALTNAPSVATGLNPEYQERQREEFRKRHAPAEYQAMTDLTDLFSTSAVALKVAKDAAAAATDPKYIAEIAEQEAAANRAQAAFDGALAD